MFNGHLTRPCVVCFAFDGQDVFVDSFRTHKQKGESCRTQNVLAFRARPARRYRSTTFCVVARGTDPLFTEGCSAFDLHKKGRMKRQNTSMAKFYGWCVWASVLRKIYYFKGPLYRLDEIEYDMNKNRYSSTELSWRSSASNRAPAKRARALPSLVFH